MLVTFHSDAWSSIKAKLGGEVDVTPLGHVRMAVARENLLELTPAHVH